MSNNQMFVQIVFRRVPSMSKRPPIVWLAL